MVVRKRKPVASRALLFNIGGVAVIGLGVVLAVRSTFAPAPEMPLCETRYAGGALFSFARGNGEALTPEDLQARLGGLDRGLIDNARIVKDDAVPYGHALEIRLKPSRSEEDEQSRSGIGFAWLPQRLSMATTACLSYSVWAPADFKPGEAVVLPGFGSEAGSDGTGTAPGRNAEAKQRESGGQEVATEPEALKPFSIRPYWRADNSVMVWLSLNVGQPIGIAVDAAKAALKPGRWTRVEQEIVLNTPGKADGILRLWVDGKLAIERAGLGFRKDEMQSFQAVVGDIHNVRHGGAWSPSPVATRIRISPIELRTN